MRRSFSITLFAFFAVAALLMHTGILPQADASTPAYKPDIKVAPVGEIVETNAGGVAIAGILGQLRGDNVIEKNNVVKQVAEAEVDHKEKTIFGAEVINRGRLDDTIRIRLELDGGLERFLVKVFTATLEEGVLHRGKLITGKTRKRPGYPAAVSGTNSVESNRIYFWIELTSRQNSDSQIIKEFQLVAESKGGTTATRKVRDNFLLVMIVGEDTGFDVRQIDRWLHANMTSWRQTGRILSVNTGGSQTCIDHDKHNIWRGKEIFGAVSEGNHWIVFKSSDGKWIAAAYSWYRPGQACKDVNAGNMGTHIGVSPYTSYRPKTGEMIYMAASTPARSTDRTSNEYTDFVAVFWGSNYTAK